MRQYLMLVLLPVLLLVGFFTYHVVQKSQMSEAPVPYEDLNRAEDAPASQPAQGKVPAQAVTTKEPSAQEEEQQGALDSDPLPETAPDGETKEPEQGSGDTVLTTKPEPVAARDIVLTKPGTLAGKRTWSMTTWSSRQAESP